MLYFINITFFYAYNDIPRIDAEKCVKEHKEDNTTYDKLGLMCFIIKKQ